MSIESTREAALICSLQTVEDLYRVKSAGISDKYFLLDVGYRPIWQFIERYASDQGELPSLSLIIQNYPNFAPVACGTVDYEVQQLHQVYMVRAVQGILTDNIDNVGTDPVLAINSMIDGLQGIKVSLNDRIGYLNADDILATIIKRFDAAGGGDEENLFSGIPTGIEVLDLMKRGWQPNELISLVARPGVGKTGVLIKFGVTAWDNGYRVLFVSPEMSREEITLRADPIIARSRGIVNFPTNWQLSTGKMSPSKLETYSRFRAEHVDDRWLTLEAQDTVDFDTSYVLSQAVQHRADIVIVDNIGYIDDSERAKTGWESMRNVVRAMKRFASTHGVPVIVAQHAKQGAVKKLSDLPELGDVYMGDALAQYSDRLMAMATSKNSPTARMLMLWKNRGDMTFATPKEISFDINTGDIGVWMAQPALKAKSELGNLFLGTDGQQYGHYSYDNEDTVEGDDLQDFSL